MESEPIFELLELDEVYLLYLEKDGSCIYAKNCKGDLVIERAFVPPDQVVRTETHCFPVGITLTAGEDIELADLVTVAVGGIVKKAKPVVSGSRTSIPKDESNTITKDDMRKMAHSLCDTTNKQKTGSLYAGFDEEGNPTVFCDPDVESKKKLDEWVNKCNDQKKQLWVNKCKQSKPKWPGYLLN